MENKNKSIKERLVALIARLGHMDNIITVVGISAAGILAAAVALVLVLDAVRGGRTSPVSGGDERYSADPTTALICLDPGHGFGDPGADSEFLGELDESDINLSVALKVRDILKNRGITVIMTRDGGGDDAPSPDSEDGLMTPVERAEFANSAGATHYISLHCDSYTADPSVSGARIYYHTGDLYSSESFRLSRSVGRSVKELTGGGEVAVKGMGDSDAYYVIKNVNSPSVLLEMGFITNEDDALSMLDSGWQDSMAAGIAEGILNFLTQ